MAWLIWKCEHITLKEKQDAWQDIIDTLPDCPVDCSFQKISSLHKFLKDTITLENKMIDDFCKMKKILFTIFILIILVAMTIIIKSIQPMMI